MGSDAGKIDRNYGTNAQPVKIPASQTDFITKATDKIEMRIELVRFKFNAEIQRDGKLVYGSFLCKSF